MIHHMKLKPIPFHQMKGGAKTIELRLYDPKRQQIKIGDQGSVKSFAQIGLQPLA